MLHYGITRDRKTGATLEPNDERARRIAANVIGMESVKPHPDEVSGPLKKLISS
jgi:hypothetical protein